MEQSSRTAASGRGAEVGDDAPDFTLLGPVGGMFTLSSLRGSKRALLIFYPKDMTGG